MEFPSHCADRGLVRDHGLVVRSTAGEHLHVGLLHEATDASADLLGRQGLAALLQGLELSEGLLLGSELLSAAGLLDVLEANADALADRAVADDLVDDHADTTGGDVPDDAGAAVVVLVGHTLAHGRIRNDVDEVADLHGGQEGRHRGDAVLTELLGEEVAGAALVTVGVDHDWKSGKREVETPLIFVNVLFCVSL